LRVLLTFAVKTAASTTRRSWRGLFRSASPVSAKARRARGSVLLVRLGNRDSEVSQGPRARLRVACRRRGSEQTLARCTPGRPPPRMPFTGHRRPRVSSRHTFE
jgi:hypothetical protein